jgi:hypothetical protein
MMEKEERKRARERNCIPSAARDMGYTHDHTLSIGYAHDHTL